MLVNTGTAITIPSGHSLELSSNSDVENNGTLTFNGSARLTETPGFPIYGTGTEVSLSVQGSPMAFTQPGGLGIWFDQGQATDSLRITRGHGALLNDLGQAGVARWYAVDADQWPSGGGIYFYVDNTELNGLATSQLVLHQSAAGSNWSFIPGVLDANNVLAGVPVNSLGTFTLFADSLVASVDESNPSASLNVYPNPANDMVVVTGLDENAPLQVYDAHGNLVRVEESGRSITSRALSIGSLANGLYVIRIGRLSVIRFLKQ